VVLIGDVPKFAFDPQRCKYKRPLSSGSQCEISEADARVQHGIYWPTLLAVQRSLPEIQLISLDEVFCHAGPCSMAFEGEIMFRDSNHLNILGSQRAGAFILETVNKH
jgi:hypothetical protein